MEYVYATLTLNELGEELNEANITTVLEAAGADVIESRVKAIVAALEDVDIDDLGHEAGIPPAPRPIEDAPSTDADVEAAGDSADAGEIPTAADDVEPVDSDAESDEIDEGIDDETTVDPDADSDETASADDETAPTIAAGVDDEMFDDSESADAAEDELEDR